MTEYAYDVDGNLDTTTYPSGLQVKLERDAAKGEVREVRTDDGTTTFAERVKWWPGGRAGPRPPLPVRSPEGVRHAAASGFVKKWSYDCDYQTNVSAVSAYAANGTATASVCLRHDALGRLVLVGKGPRALGDGTSCVRDSDVTEPTLSLAVQQLLPERFLVAGAPMSLSAERPKDLVALAIGQVVLAGVVLFAYGARWYTLLGALLVAINVFRYLRAAMRQQERRKD